MGRNLTIPTNLLYFFLEFKYFINVIVNKLIPAIIFLSFSYSSYAEIYKHVDKEGQVIYSNVKDSGTKMALDTGPVFSGFYNDFKYQYISSEAIPHTPYYNVDIYYESITDQLKLFNDIIPYVAKLEKTDIDCQENSYSVNEIKFYESNNFGVHRYSYFPTISERFLKAIKPNSPYQKAFNFVCKNQSEVK